MIPTSYKKGLADGYSFIEFVFDNLEDITYDSEREAFNHIKSYCKKSNKDSIYYPINNYYMALDVSYDIIDGINKGILCKSEALGLIKISESRGLNYDWDDVYEVLDDKYPCNDLINDVCIDCGNCD